MSDDPFETADPAIREFSRGHYRLAGDLAAMERVRAAGAAEAAVFYAGRILEVLAAQAAEDLGLRAHGTLLANLDVLEQYTLVPVTARYCAHALRRLANDARHIVRPIMGADAELARLFVGLAMEWYFCLYPFGPRAQMEARESAAVRVQELVAACESVPAEELLRRVTEDGNFSKTPAVLAVVAEALLDFGRMKEAGMVVERGLRVFPGDVRLELLRGLCLSRAELLEEAVGVLEPLFRRMPGDAEAAGILAGVYKRLWLQEPEKVAWLKRSHETYMAGWKGSRESNAYLGTNAAATALWLGRGELSRGLAREVGEMVRDRMQRLAKKIAVPEESMGFWSAATVAELALLNGEVEAGRRAYEQLFARHPEKQGAIEVARRQAELILRHRS